MDFYFMKKEHFFMKCSGKQGFLYFLVLFREEAGKFAVIGKTKAVGFFAHDLIKFGIGCFDIRHNEELADAAAKKTEKYPAIEGKTEDKDFPFFAFGHLF